MCFCLLYTVHTLASKIKISEIIAKNVLKQQATLLEKSFISMIKKQLSICYKWSVGCRISYS